jgi:hypothetical protein
MASVERGRRPVDRRRALTLLGRPIASTGGSVSCRGDNISISGGLVAI